MRCMPHRRMRLCMSSWGRRSLDCVVCQGVAQFPGLPASGLATATRAGPAIAVIRPYQIGLVAGPGAAVVQSVHAYGALKRVRVLVGGHGLEVLLPAEEWTPAVGESCGLDLGRARIYPG